MAEGAPRKGTTGRKGSDGYRLADTTLDGTLDEWPREPPRAARTAVEETQLVLIRSPGTIHRLAWKLNDVGRASRIALAFRRASPAKLDPSASGRFDAQAFFDPEAGKWQVAARYCRPGRSGTAGSRASRAFSTWRGEGCFLGS